MQEASHFLLSPSHMLKDSPHPHSTTSACPGAATCALCLCAASLLTQQVYRQIWTVKPRKRLKSEEQVMYSSLDLMSATSATSSLFVEDIRSNCHSESHSHSNPIFISKAPTLIFQRIASVHHRLYQYFEVPSIPVMFLLSKLWKINIHSFVLVVC